MARRSQRLLQRLDILSTPSTSPPIVVSPYFPKTNSKNRSTGKQALAAIKPDPADELHGPLVDVSTLASTHVAVDANPKVLARAKSMGTPRMLEIDSSLAGREPCKRRRHLIQRPSSSFRGRKTSETTKRRTRNSMKPSGKHATTSRESDSAIRNRSDESGSWDSAGSSLETDRSSDDFEPLEPSGFRRSMAQSIQSSIPVSNLRLRNRVTRRNVSRSTNPENTKELSFEGESDDPDDWVDVGTCDLHELKEVDFMQSLLNAEAQKENVDKFHSDNTVLTVSVPKCPLSGKKLVSDPELQARQEALRRLKEAFKAAHHVHVLCFLAHVRFLNSLCDNPLYRSVGLSLLCAAQPFLLNNSSPTDITLWSLEHLQSCVSCILSHNSSSVRGDHSSGLTLLHRVANHHASSTDCVVLLVGALRSLGFDVRLITALKPLPLNPSKTTSKSLRTPRHGKKSKMNNREIVSCSSSAEEDYCPPSSAAATSSIYTFAEVYLPSLQRWVCVQLSAHDGSVDRPLSIPPSLYVIGATSVRLCNVENCPYIGRNPVDLTARYDPDWSVKSRLHRLPSIKWNQMLRYQQHLFDLLAAMNGSLVAKTDDLATLQRDITDEQRIHSELLLKPLPDRVQDFKNHPLYALPRHLLKFEVIYPPDAPPVGFFRNEPVYHRECVHICSTRETWLKEAKVVRLHEKPVKVVKARMSMKRKLLQGTDSSPATVELFGPWQLEDYKPPVAQNGVVPRNEHGTVDMFKPCMLPIGCAHICLTGIQHIAKKLGIDCAPAIVGWTFKGSGWAIPTINGYIVCKEDAPVLVDAWRSFRMDAAKAAAEERSSRAIDNWRRLVRGLFLWHKVKAQFALAALHDAAPSKRSRLLTHKKNVHELTSNVPSKSDPFVVSESAYEKPAVTTPVELDKTNSGGWKSLTSGHSSSFVTFPRCFPVTISNRASDSFRSRQVRPKRLRSRRKARSPSSTSEETDGITSCHEPSSSVDSDQSSPLSANFVTGNVKPS